MTQGKARDKGARESKVLEDVLSLCLSSGGQRAKAARKLAGEADSSVESPDIRVSIANRDAISSSLQPAFCRVRAFFRAIAL